MAYERRSYELDVDDFLGHSGSSGSSGTFLDNWRKAGRIDVWLHPQGKPAPLWAHRWFDIRKDRETGDPILFPMRWNSLEKESVLKRRHFRNNDGSLEFPPEICPFSKLLEWVHQAVEEGVIDWTAPIFEFDDVSEPVVIHAGGFTGRFGRKDLSREDKQDLRRAGINGKESWKENCHARLQYVFRVVPNVDPESCKIALEAQALGDQVKRVIRDRKDDMAERGKPELGDPFLNPYAIRWEYDENEDFARRYTAKAMTAIEMSPEVEDLLNEDPPSIDDLMAPGNLAKLRTSFEAHWAAKTTPPWDEIFGTAEAALEQSKDEPDEEPPARRERTPEVRSRREPERDETPKARRRDDDERPARDDRARRFRDDERPARHDEDDKPARRQRDDEPPPRQRKAEPKPEPEEELFECDVCKAAIKATDKTCANCGTIYDEDGQVLKRGTLHEERERAKPRSRSAARATRTPARREASGDDADDDDDLPF